MNKSVDSLLHKIKNSINIHCLMAMDCCFRDVGLTVIETNKNKVVISKIIDGRPMCGKIIEDYIIIGDSRDCEQFTERTINCILDFVTNASTVDEFVPDKNKVNNFYGEVVVSGSGFEKSSQI